MKTPSHQRTTVAAKSDGSLRVGVVADTHSHPNARGLEHLTALAPDLILHAGDIGELTVLDTFRAIAPTLAVRGNIDERSARDVPDALTVELTDQGHTVLTLLLTHIALGGPKIRADAARLARAQKASLIVCGHSHVPFAGVDRGLTVFNPGSIGPRRFTLPILFGVLELSRSGVQVRHVDCETGKRWDP
jgi:putative phosphoesterase